ncbi:MAG: hypothetical protein ACKOPS_03925, partial [Cyanobium sp.]
AVAALACDGDHRDPFDRLLVCQSRTEPMLLLTADRQLARYGTTVTVGARARNTPVCPVVRRTRSWTGQAQPDLRLTSGRND